MSWIDLILIAALMFVLLLAGLPMWVPFLIAPLMALWVFYPDVNLHIVFPQQVIVGLQPLTLTCVPMFIFAADLICRGQAAEKLVNAVKSWVGHLPGGVAISAAGGCTVFGSVSGSAQATVVAIGKPMRPALLEAGYSSSWAFGIIVSSAGIALLIPPSLASIIYGVAAETSIGAVFLAGFGSGLLVFFLFSIYSVIYSKIKGVGRLPKASWSERFRTTRAALPVFGFPVIILGGIYSGLFSPTEAAAVCVAYAIIVEAAIYRDINFKDIVLSAIASGLIMGIVLFLVGLGRFMSWVLAYAGVPGMILPPLLGPDPTQLRLIIIVMVAYFFACMFVDIVIALYVLTPIFAPYVIQLGIDPVYMGALVVLQSCLGVTSPPFGINIFTAAAVFKRPFWEVTKGVFPFIALMLLANVIIIAVPDIVMWLPDAMLGVGP